MIYIIPCKDIWVSSFEIKDPHLGCDFEIFQCCKCGSYKMIQTFRIGPRKSVVTFHSKKEDIDQALKDLEAEDDRWFEEEFRAGGERAITAIDYAMARAKAPKRAEI